MLAQIKQYLLAKPETSLGYPFGDDIMVFIPMLPQDTGFSWN